MNQASPIFMLRIKAIGLLLFLSIIYGFWQHFSADILPIHECRKSDSLTQAVQYFRGTSFLEIKMQQQSSRLFIIWSAKFGK